ncbi:uncharacterized protein LOC143078546 [Mytilus galloprovincialis]|uniref:uncharacterized protein LOC143078546 n=1 Tax=Mytilus galloprovincialis TaxID=29158 RepID=UPI003F7C3034
MTDYNGGQEQMFYIIVTDKDGFWQMYSTGVVGNEKGITKRYSLTMPAGQFNFDVFGNNSFGNATAKGTSCGVQDQAKHQSGSSALVGGITGSISALLIVIFVIGVIYFIRRRHINGEDKTLIKRLSNETDEDEEVL